MPKSKAVRRQDRLVNAAAKYSIADLQTAWRKRCAEIKRLDKEREVISQQMTILTLAMQKKADETRKSMIKPKNRLIVDNR
jgi:hypothetical protein